MNRFFVDCELVVGGVLTLPDDVAHHWGKVLRARVGDNAVLFNGRGGEYAATLTHIDKKSAQVTIDDHKPKTIINHSYFDVHVLIQIAINKSVTSKCNKNLNTCS